MLAGAALVAAIVTLVVVSVYIGQELGLRSVDLPLVIPTQSPIASALTQVACSRCSRNSITRHVAFFRT